jgi:hypothetical protein
MMMMKLITKADDFDNMEDVHNMTLAELFGRNELRRDERVRRERDERQALRALTQDNTVTNSGILFLLCYSLSLTYF